MCLILLSRLGFRVGISAHQVLLSFLVNGHGRSMAEWWDIDGVLAFLKCLLYGGSPMSKQRFEHAFDAYLRIEDGKLVGPYDAKTDVGAERSNNGWELVNLVEVLLAGEVDVYLTAAWKRPVE